jgi:hypothetical protein
LKEVLRAKQNSRKKRVSRQTCIATQNNDLFISQTAAAADYSDRFQDMYTFSELIWNIRKVGKIDSRKMQGQSAFIRINET